ncbi:MAG TPA: hypothetical protein VFN74_18460 [Chloroflexota bacterium]|nr:hypothetical protein [Chloroflexota bacterium]
MGPSLWQRVSRRAALTALSVGTAVLTQARPAFSSDVDIPETPPRRARRRRRRPVDLERGWEEREGDLLLRRTQRQHRVRLVSGEEVAFELQTVDLHHFPGWTDSNSPAFWRDGRMVMFNSAEEPVRSAGTSLETLADPVGVWCTPCTRPGGRWIEAVWPDPETGVLYGWYHYEPGDLACQTAPLIGAAISRDGGLTWRDQGVVLENGYGIDCGFQNGFFVGGNGDFHVIPDREQGYFYFLFSNYAGPVGEQGVGIARGPFHLRGQPGTVNKYYRGEWNEPGRGGKVTPLLRSTTGWQGPHVEAFWGPSVHWNEHLQRYVAVLNHTDGREWAQEGIYMMISPELIRWTEPWKILEANEWYPELVGVFPGGTDTRAGQTARLYVGGVSAYELVFM